MAAEDETALEREDEVLPDRLDALEPPAVEQLGDPERRGPRVRRLDGDDRSFEHTDALGDPPQAVSLGHRSLAVRPA